MHHYKISQIPVSDGNNFVGSLTDTKLFSSLLEKPELKELPVKTIMENAFPVVKGDSPISSISKLFGSDVPAILVNYEEDKYHIITRQDMIKAIC